MSEFNEAEVLAQLESVTEWDSPAIIETDSEWLLSLDATCGSLAQIFADYVSVVGLASATKDDFTQKLTEIASSMNVEFTVQRDLLIRSIIQTRGDGVCMTFDEQGRPGEHILLSDESRLRGTFIGIGILPILTNESLASDETDATNLPHEPTLCLLIENTNISGLGDVASFQDVMAIALRVGGVHIDQVVAREATTS